MDTSRIAYGQVQPITGRDRVVAADAQPKPAGSATVASLAVPAPSVQDAAAIETPKPPLEDLQRLLEQAGRHIHPEWRSLSFEVREELGRAVVSVYDADTEELIRQIPPETAVRIATAMREIAQQGNDTLPASGLLLDERA
jgi:flagellar protein FlaG